jgi:hypothetical protein
MWTSLPTLTPRFPLVMPPFRPLPTDSATGEERDRYVLHGTSVAVMPTVRITASGWHARG